jgi:DinB family protein
MKNLIWIFVSLFVLACNNFAQAQSIPVLVNNDFARAQSADARRTNTQIVSYILDFQERRVLGVAEAMPAEKYSFAPTAGAFQGVRTFAEELKHIAADNFLLGAGILGQKAPVDVGSGENGSNEVRTKPEIIAYLKASFTYMHRAADAIDDEKRPIDTPDISPWPAGTATRLGVAIEDCVHTWDHYGQLVEYLRMNNIIPPGSK